MKVVTPSSGATTIELDEKFDFSAVGEFRKIYESIDKLPQKKLVIDFKKTRYIDSSALGMLINARSHFSANGVKISLENTNEQIQKIFSISRFETKFDIS